MYYFIHLLYIHITYEALGKSIYRTPNASARAINNIGFIGRRWVFVDHLDAAGAGGEFKRDTAGDLRSMDHALVLQEQRLQWT